jgi:hypothetical protein
MAELHHKNVKLEALVESFQNNNEEYIKVTKAVEQKVLSALSNAKVLLRYALLSITESARNDPERYRLIFYNMPSSRTDYYSSSCQQYYTASDMYGGQIQQPQQYQSPDYNTEVNVAMIVDEAEKLYNKLVKGSMNKIITYHTFSKSSLPSLPLLSASEEEQ